jgi:hypothetical protein
MRRKFQGFFGRFAGKGRHRAVFSPTLRDITWDYARGEYV